MINWGDLSGVFGSLVSLVVAIGGLAYWIEGRFSRAREERIKQIAVLEKDATAAVVDCWERSRKYTDENRHALDLAHADLVQESRKFQMGIHENYVRERSLYEVESRIMGAIGELKSTVEGMRTQRNNGTS